MSTERHVQNAASCFRLEHLFSLNKVVLSSHMDFYEVRIYISGVRIGGRRDFG